MTPEEAGHPEIDAAIAGLERAGELAERGQFDDALKECEAAATAFEMYDGALSPDLANVLNTLSSIQFERAEYEAAVQAATRSADILERLGDRFTGPEAALIRSQAYSALGTALRTQGRYREAEPWLQRALAAVEAEFGAGHAESGAACNNLAIVYKYTAEYDKAETLYRRALAISETHFGVDAPESASIYHNLGGLDHARGEFAAGEPHARKAYEIRLRALGAEDPATAADAAALAGVLDGLERYEESELLYSYALGVFERVYGPDHYEIAVNLNNLAAIRREQDQPEEAERLFRRALEIKRRVLGNASPDTAVT
ncbi:MAG: tetratricopeptide repeat protein, partial [Bryobacteraceae bacterium]